MTGNEEARHCTHCHQNVYNLSELTRAQAEELVRSANARLCLRYLRRADGTMLLRDGAVAYRPTRLIAAGLAALALTGAGALVRATEVQPLTAFDPAPPSAPREQLERDIHVAHELAPPPPIALPHPRPRRPPPVEVEREIYHETGVVLPARVDRDLYETLGK